MKSKSEGFANNSLTAVSSFFPLCLEFNGGHNKAQRQWMLKFQQRPTPKIILTGDYPTRDEIIECLSSMSAPIIMISICEIAAAVATRNNL